MDDAKEGTVIEVKTRSRSDTIAKLLDENAEEALRFLTKAFRGAVDLGEDANRRLLGQASASVSNWTRYQQTQSAREQTRVAMASMLADAEGANRAEYIRLSMPNHTIVRALPTPKPVEEPRVS